MSSEPSSYAEHRNEGRFSLYSTDTDDQVALAHKGLDRCAALLKTLLSPDSTPGKKPGLSGNGGGGGGGGKKGERKKPIDTSARRRLSKGALRGGKHKAFQPFPGASRYEHDGRTTSLTHVARHRRSKTAPVDITESSRQACGNRGPTTTSKALHNSIGPKGKSLSKNGARRRSDSIPGKGAPSNSAGSLSAKGGRRVAGKSQSVWGRSQSRLKMPTRAHHAQGEHAVSSPEGNISCVPREKVHSQLLKDISPRSPHSEAPTGLHLPGTSSPHYSAPLPSSVAPVCYHSLYPPKHPWLCPPCQHTKSLDTKFVPGHPGSVTSPPQQQSCAHVSIHPYRMQESPTYPIDPPLLASHPCGYVFKPPSDPVCATTHPSATSHAARGDSAMPSTQPGVGVVPQHGNTRKRRHSKMASELPLRAEGVGPYPSPPGALLPLVQEMQHSLQHSLQRLKASVSLKLKDQVERIEHSQSQYQSRLATFCRQLGSFEGVRDRGGLSTADWLAQIQQIELDKAHMLERVIQSEMAFSEARQELDNVRREVAVLRSEQEATSGEFISVKNELLTATDAIVELRREKEAAEEELKAMKSLYDTVKSQLKQENSAQLKSLEQQLASSKEETLKSEKALWAAKRSLEATREEMEMTRLSLTEKETELVQAQDQMLGLRQCIAYFLSEPVKLGGCEVAMQAGCYCISEKAMKRLQALVNDGNVDSFLGAYTSTVKDDTASLNSSTTPTVSCSQSLENSPIVNTRQQSEQDSNEDPDGSLEHVKSSGLDKELFSSVLPRRDSLSSYHRIKLGSGGLQNASGVVIPRQRVGSDANKSVIFDLQSLLTTSSEVEFQRDLASLDADIARLQLQFSVAFQGASY